MNFTLKIKQVKTINEIEGYWSNTDFINLLDILEFPIDSSSSQSEVREMLEMALSDQEPHESASLLLTYKLQDKLNKGQIRNLSHIMVDDNESEENADFSVHYPLFNINQLLFRAYNGTFPNAKATKIDIELKFKEDVKNIISKELVLKSVSKCLSENSPPLRLFEEQLNGKEKFSDAEYVIWEQHNNGNNQFTIITSDYWINEDDIMNYEFSGSIKLFKEKE